MAKMVWRQAGLKVEEVFVSGETKDGYFIDGSFYRKDGSMFSFFDTENEAIDEAIKKGDVRYLKLHEQMTENTEIIKSLKSRRL